MKFQPCCSMQPIGVLTENPINLIFAILNEVTEDDNNHVTLALERSSEIVILPSVSPPLSLSLPLFPSPSLSLTLSLSLPLPVYLSLYHHLVFFSLFFCFTLFFSLSLFPSDSQTSFISRLSGGNATLNI